MKSGHAQLDYRVLLAAAHLVLLLLTLSQVALPAKKDGTVPGYCCTSQNHSKIATYSVAILVCFIMLKLVERDRTKSAAAIGVTAVVALVTWIVTVAVIEETFWWHACWLTIGIVTAVALKSWQIELMTF